MTKYWCFSFILYACTSVCAGMSACMPTGTHRCLWMSEVDMGCLPALSTSAFETRVP